MIKIENLTIGYRDKVVAEGLNAELFEGELTCLIGTNGVGKSTLLRQLAQTYKGQCAIVLTEKPDIRNISVRELVGLGRSPYTGFFGMLKDADKRIVDEAMLMAGVSELAQRSFFNLSDGEKQKVMIAKALAQQTPIIFMDEPTAFLDYPSKIETFQLLARVAKEQQKAILLSTHDFELALRHCHKVWIFDAQDGIVMCQPDEVSFNMNERNFRKQE
ncbi:MAG: ABC transporter ATP-binding protein [Prevotellaceae bacterium]|nr:ABC transporter ATP-binding protein [Prevotellaceae bacterium]